MSRKPQMTAAHHDGSAPNCVHHGDARDRGEPVRPDRVCVRCKREARRAKTRRAVRA